jgi:hypothetical protein
MKVVLNRILTLAVKSLLSKLVSWLDVSAEVLPLLQGALESQDLLDLLCFSKALLTYIPYLFFFFLLV